MVNKSSSLVRPRTVMQATTQTKKPNKRSILILSLCGTCLFLFIICAALITALVLVGKNLSYQSQGKRSLVDNTSVSLADNTNYNRNLTFHLANFDTSEVNKSHIPKTMSKVVEQLRWRLPNEIKPILYNILLHPDLKSKTFSGNISINVRVNKPINYIAVHSKRLTITKTVLERVLSKSDSEIRESKNVPVINAFEYPEYEYWITEVEKPLDVGDYVLGLTFNGSLTDRIVGFYQSSYFDAVNNRTRLIATSKFEPTYARQAFPCFDEPNMKAEFKVSLVRPTGDGYSALSNMNELSSVENVGTGTTTVEFNTSVPMSTYVSCFIVSDFLHKSKVVNAQEYGKNFDMRVFATPAQLEKVNFALETGVKVTEYYIKYFQLAYPLPKLDMAAIPDFVSGAMEHWGLVTFRETSLLYDKDISSTANKQRVASVVAHELAHMWFGNLVTMDWWNDLWLNEGFATYMQYKGTEEIYPEWKMTDQFLISDLHGVLSLDATLASHPIVQPVDNPDQITELFDTITYSKGASIIRMLEDFVGKDNFRTAVSNYLKAHEFKNAVTDDLLTEIANLGLGLDVKYIMSTWTKQSGFPVVNVEKVSPTVYKLTQKRFLSNPDNENSKVQSSEFNYRWTIPITYETDVSPLERIRFENNDIEISINVPGNHKWLKLNKDQIGYYRVNYPKDMWQAFADTLVETFNSFSIADRAHLINDAFSLAEATQLDYDIALNLTKYLTNENEYVPWDVASSKISGLKNQLYLTEYNGNFQKYGHTVIAQAYTNVGWDVNTEEHLKNLLRTTILSLACSLDYTKCIDEVGQRFTTWLKNPSVRPTPDLRNIIYYYGMVSVGNEQSWNQMWDLYIAEQDAQEKVKLMYGLAGVQEPWLLQKYIDLAWDENNVRSQDYFTCMQYIAANRAGETLVWDYVRENWPKLVKRFGINERYLGRMIPSITGRFNTKVKLDEVKDFFKRYPEAGAGAAARKQTIENINTRIKWLELNKENVGKWLKDNYP